MISTQDVRFNTLVITCTVIVHVCPSFTYFSSLALKLATQVDIDIYSDPILRSLVLKLRS